MCVCGEKFFLFKYIKIYIFVSADKMDIKTHDQKKLKNKIKQQQKMESKKKMDKIYCLFLSMFY